MTAKDGAAVREAPPRHTAGVTLVELLMALTLLGIVLGSFVLAGVRNEETHRSLAMRHRARVQLREAVAALPLELRGVSAADGDITPGEASDSTLEFRATMASGVVCASRGDTVELPRANAEWSHYAAISRPEPGDSVWLLQTGDSLAWAGRRIEAVSTRSGSCGAFDDSSSGGTRLLLRLSAGTSEPMPGVGAPARVTRRLRYSIYRSSTDGGWYLGAREWNAALGRFDVVQPIAGPFTSPRETRSRPSRFRYYDADDNELPSGTARTDLVRRIVLSLCAEEKLRRERPGTTPTIGSCPGEEMAASVALRDRR